MKDIFSIAADARRRAQRSAPRGAAQAWKPTKPVEFVVTSGAGGGTDNFARIDPVDHRQAQADGAAGRRRRTRAAAAGAEGYRLRQGRSRATPTSSSSAPTTPICCPTSPSSPTSPTDLTPVAALALDEFLLWVKGDAPYTDAKSFIEAAKAKPGAFKMGGSQSKDTDQTLTEHDRGRDRRPSSSTCRSRAAAAAAVQLAGGHIDANVNNPNENIGQWKAGRSKPLCVFSAGAPARPASKVSATRAGATSRPARKPASPLDTFQMPRTVWLPAGVPADAVAFYADVLKKVSETPEWKDYVERTVADRPVPDGRRAASASSPRTTPRTARSSRREGWVVK